MGNLNSFLTSRGGNLNRNFPKIQMPGELSGGGGVFKLRFDFSRCCCIEKSSSALLLLFFFFKYFCRMTLACLPSNLGSLNSKQTVA